MSRGYDSMLVYARLGGDRKFRRLSPAERWCAVFGVWAIAAQSPVRGYLLITEDEPAQDRDYATEANVALGVARSTMTKMRSLGMLEMDPEMGAEHVHDWHEHQKDPKPSESKQAWRDRKRQQRQAHQSPANVPRDMPPVSRRSHTTSLKREEKERTTETSSLSCRGELVDLSHRLADRILANDSKATVTPDGKGWLDPLRLLIDKDGRSVEEVRRVVDWCQADEFWRRNILSPAKLRKQFTTLLLSANGSVSGKGALAERDAMALDRAMA
jgi:hypothetical protein